MHNEKFTRREPNKNDAKGTFDSKVAIIKKPHGFQVESAMPCWTKPLRGGKTSAIFILSLWERLSSREKSWQNATHTVSGNEPELIMRITEKNLALYKKTT